MQMTKKHQRTFGSFFRNGRSRAKKSFTPRNVFLLK
jgi:hypothetical protein